MDSGREWLRSYGVPALFLWLGFSLTVEPQELNVRPLASCVIGFSRQRSACR